MARAPRKGKAVKVGELLPRVLRTSGLAVRVAQAAVVVDWPGLVGPAIANHAEAVSVTQDGTLFVRVVSAAWRQELSLMAPQIIAKLNAGRKTGRIERIRWMLG